MKMQLRYILKLSAIDDEPVGGEFELLHEKLHSGIQVGEKGGVCRVEVSQRGDRFLGDDQHVERIGWLRVAEGHQRIRLAQAFNGDHKTHVSKHPSDH